MRIHRLIAGLALAIAVPVLAQTPAPAPTAPPAADLPKHKCTKPGDFPGRLATEGQHRQYQKDYIGYTDCLKKFALDQQALAEPHMKASNATINEYNAAVKAYNDEIQKQNEGNK
jgi:hypothetical protein